MFRLFLNCLFFSSSKSLSILSFNFSSDSAGFKSIFNIIFLSLKRFSIFLYLTRCAELLNIVGPDTPKCVNIISPKSSYIMRFFDVSFNWIFTFFNDSPCNSFSTSYVSNGTSDGFISVIVCPSSFAILYPSPVEPVSG